MKLNLLVVTDHTTHAESNSVYHLCHALSKDPRCKEIWVCSRGIPLNHEFFQGDPHSDIFAAPVKHEFEFKTADDYLNQRSTLLEPKEIDVILIRMPQPLNPVFLKSLESIVPPHKIINSPKGIIETSNKAFLLELAHLCPEPLLCSNLQQAMDLSQHTEIVLKPLYSYGGRGILRLSADYCWRADERYPIGEVSSILTESQFPMMALKFLKNVTQGDKRTIIVNQKILGSALRMPAPGSWVCNVAQGGHAVHSHADEDEMIIERYLTPLLLQKGVVIYGFDTLVNDEGRRVLSEINTLSTGGLLPLEQLSGRPVVREAAGALLDFLEATS